MSAEKQEQHKHALHKFHCLETETGFPHQLLICFGCGRAFTEERSLKDAGVAVR